jgi:hypothetical protein
MCYSFYRIIPTSLKTKWLKENYLNSEDEQILADIKNIHLQGNKKD